MNDDEKDIFYSFLTTTLVLVPIYYISGKGINDILKYFGLNAYMIVALWIVMYLICIGTCMASLEQQRAYKTIIEQGKKKHPSIHCDCNECKETTRIQGT